MSAYRLLSFSEEGAPRAGVSVGDTVIDIAKATGRPELSALGEVFRTWGTTESLCRQLAADSGSLESAVIKPLAALEIAAPWIPGNIFCAGANYQDHVEEMARVMNAPVALNAKQLGDNPWHFIKTSRSAVVGHGAQVAIPRFSTRLDHEIELGVVIGREARDVSIEDAIGHVAGYTIANDLSVREVGRAASPAGSPFHYDWITMKCFDGSCPLGPWVVPAAQITEPQNLAMKLSVNGQLHQDSSTRHMIFDIAEQIAWLSSRVTLQPGDLILTGTPAGVGMPYQRFLAPGDQVSLWIEGIGELSHGIRSP
ncbi:2-keto-4-pentenoate hydratase [Pseudoxanthomonas jiangsuensis]|uniref:fumarylacetoacetate hydrolase family protein n=1 Tax=Pseudoxanthomonas jiangsuensis TaxID=619688 RepID=UPI0013909BB6|nr:fumarylacetoacetate hydrolase family protein [Pseudoxanthomonas jiangsuensis]KAF1697261.1 2-keto-4-pentenoate hydratase [Pseudoxanthomonas jiangsuensis]